MIKRLFFCAGLLATALTVSADPADTLRNRRIDAVVVTALRSPMIKENVPYVVETVGQADIRQSSAMSLSEIVKTFTPTESADLQGLTGGFEFRSFGVRSAGRNTYTLMLLDGMRTGTANGATSFPNRYSSVEMLKGPFSALYGSGAMGGVVNATTPQSRGKLSGDAAVGYGSWQTFSAGASVGGSITDRLDFDLSLDYARRGEDYRTGGHNVLNMTSYEKAIYDPASRDTTYQRTTWDKTQGVVRVGWDINRYWRLNLYNSLYYTGDARSNGNLWGVSDKMDMRVLRGLHRLDVTGSAGRHALRISPFITYEDSHYTDISQWAPGKRDEDYNTWGVLVQDAISMGWGTLTVGVDNLSERFITRRTTMDGDQDVPWRPDYTNIQTGVFAQLSFSLLEDHLQGIAGLRYDNIAMRTRHTPGLDNDPASRDYNTLNPNASLQYRLLDNRLRIHTGVGRAFLAPAAFSITGEYTDSWGYTYTGNPDLKPETSFTWESGVGYASPSRVLEADLSLFFTRHNDICETTWVSDYDYTYTNTDSGKYRGVEASAAYDLGAALGKGYSLRFSGAWMRIFRDEMTRDGVTTHANYLSRTKITFGTDFSMGRLTLAAQARYIGGKIEKNYLNNYAPFYTPSGTRVREATEGVQLLTTPDYLVADLSASVRVAKNVSVGAKAANLLDERYMERDGYFMPGRNFNVNVRVTF